MTASISAYDLGERVARYDADMDLMHPNRRKMAALALEFLPLARQGAWRALDLGCGTGYLAGEFLGAFPNLSVVALDGAETMIDHAKERLAVYAARLRYVVSDFRDLEGLAPSLGVFDVVFSSYGLHHLNADEKLTALKACRSMLNDGGWFLNLDLLDSETEALNARTQELRIEGIVARAAGKDPRFKTVEQTRRFIADLEAAENDQPLKLEDDLAILRRAGFENAAAIWREFREAVTCGQRVG